MGSSVAHIATSVLLVVCDGVGLLMTDRQRNGIHALMVHCSSIVLHKLLHEFVAFKTIFGWAHRSSKKRPLHGDAAMHTKVTPNWHARCFATLIQSSLMVRKI